MKRQLWILGISIAVLSLVAIAAEQQGTSESAPSDVKVPPRTRRPVDSRRPTLPPEQMEALRSRSLPMPGLAGHQQIIRELEEIKKVAQEENAVKTAEAIQNLIDKKNAEYKRMAAQQEKMRQQMQKRFEERKSNIQRPESLQPSADDTQTDAPTGEAGKKERQPKGKNK